MTSDTPAELLDLLRWLQAAGYRFVTPTPRTHARVLKRDPSPARDVRGVLGWSRPFAPGSIDPELEALLESAGLTASAGDLRRATARVSTVAERLFVHSAFPTDDDDAVFLGPDSYRFADFLARELGPELEGVIVDVGSGSGVGAVVTAGLCPAARVIAADVNATALRYARASAAHAGVAIETLLSDGLDAAPDGLAAVLANPPYIAHGGQTYRDGGGLQGGQVSVDWARAALGTLRPGGRLLLYTGSAIQDGGHDILREALAGLAGAAGATMDYREIDPDVFGEELDEPAYARVERIAVVTCVMTVPG